MLIREGAAKKPPEARLKGQRGSFRLGDSPAETLRTPGQQPHPSETLWKEECKTVTALILILYPACLSNLSLLTGSGHSLEALAYSVPTLPDTVIKPFFLSRLWLCLLIFVWLWSKESQYFGNTFTHLPLYLPVNSFT